MIEKKYGYKDLPTLPEESGKYKLVRNERIISEKVTYDVQSHNGRIIPLEDHLLNNWFTIYDTLLVKKEVTTETLWSWEKVVEE